MEWQPIETAPKDGTSFMGWNKEHGSHQCLIPENTAHYKRVTARYGKGHCGNWFCPTHWMPLPASPTT